MSKPINQLPEDSDRDRHIREAESQMRLLLTDWSIASGLTAAEEARALAHFAHYLASRMNYAVQAERRQPCCP